MLRYLLLVISICFPAFITTTQAQTLRASAPSVVEVGERFHVQYTINSQDVPEPEWPSFSGFEVLYGPSISRQSSVQIIDGNMSSSSAITYSFILVCNKAGVYNINPASVAFNGKTLSSQALKIRVVGSSAAAQQRQQQASQYDDRQVAANTRASNGRDLFMTANASKVNVFEQEAILITYKVYTLVNINRLEGKLPTLDGFQIQEIPLSREKSFEIEAYKGQRYNTVVWAQYIVYPQKAGDLTIPAITYEATEVRANQAIDPIDAFFNGVSTTEVKRKIVTPKLTIHVSPLPSKPENFCGAVGHFDVSSSISTESVKANDALTVRVRLRGTGNMKLISAPEINFPKDFETYEPKVNDNFSLTKEGLSGVKEFEYLVVPRHKGKFTIPACDFTYFDSQSHTYKTLSTQTFTVNVEKGVAGSASSVDFANQQSVDQIATDIRYIKTGDVHLRQDGGDSMLGSATYWLLYLLALVVASVIAIVGRKRIIDNGNIAKMRGRKANKVAIRRLKNAAKLLANHDAENFYDEVMRALLGYTADKLTIPLAVLNKDNIQSELQGKNVDQDLIDLFIKCLNDCEFARYAPGNPDETMENVYEGAVNAITDMESKINKTIKHRGKVEGRIHNSNDSGMALLLTLLLTLTLSLFGSSLLHAQTKAEADTLYVNEEYSKAAAMYEKILAEQGKSADIYYNLGNCYYKKDNISRAILNYERAHILDPGDDDIIANLAFVRGKTADKVTPPSELFFVTWWHDIVNTMFIDTWLILALSAFILMLVGILVYAFMGSELIRRIGINGAFVALVVCVVALCCAVSQYNQIRNHRFAIITVPALTVKSTPSDGSTDLFVIHDGSKVEILDNSMTDWYEVKLEEGKQGWVDKSSLEVI